MIVALVANAVFEYALKNVLSVRDVLIALGCSGALYAQANPVAVIAGGGRAQRRRESSGATEVPRTWPAGMSRAAVCILLAALAVVLVLLAFAPRLGVLALVCMKVDALALAALRAGVEVLWVVLASGAVAAIVL